MGCWIETCAITRTPIMYGDEAVMVCINPYIGGDTVLSPNRIRTSSAFGDMFDLRCVTEIHKGTYDDYGWLKEVEKDIPEGLYHDRRVSDDQGRNLFLVFLHRQVWDAIFDYEKFSQPLRVHSDQEAWEEAVFTHLPNADSSKIPEHFLEFCYVLRFANEVRADILSGQRWRGAQQYGDEEQRALLLDLTRNHEPEYLDGD